MNALREQIIQVAFGWLGTPYHHHARVKGVGVDCVQFLIAVYAECGVVQEAMTGTYPQDWHLHRSEEKYLAGIRQYANQTDTPEPGDIALFRFGRCVSHAGILLPEPRQVIHAFAGSGVIVSSMDGQELNGRFNSIWTVAPTVD